MLLSVHAEVFRLRVSAALAVYYKNNL